MNEGRCWFKYHFTDHQFHVTGLVTEPGAKTMKFSLWGNTLPSPEWQVITIDFEQVLGRACKLTILYKKKTINTTPGAGVGGEVLGVVQCVGNSQCPLFLACACL